jgi:hypothetical protein
LQCGVEPVVSHGTTVFERLTVPARRAIVAAHDEARAAGRKTMGAADLVAGCLRAEGAVAAALLRASGIGAVEPADPTGDAAADDPDNLLHLVVVAAAGVATARRSRSIGTVSLLLGLITLEPSGLTAILDRASITLDELAGAARAVDDTGESMLASTDSMTPTGDAAWIVTLGGSDPDVMWSDKQP